jgi:hypothetical protein
MGWKLEKLWFDSQELQEIFLFPTATRLLLMLIQPLIHWAIWGFISKGKAAKAKADLSPLTSAGG